MIACILWKIIHFTAVWLGFLGNITARNVLLTLNCHETLLFTNVSWACGIRKFSSMDHIVVWPSRYCWDFYSPKKQFVGLHSMMSRYKVVQIIAMCLSEWQIELTQISRLLSVQEMKRKGFIVQRCKWCEHSENL